MAQIHSLTLYIFMDSLEVGGNCISRRFGLLLILYMKGLLDKISLHHHLLYKSVRLSRQTKIATFLMPNQYRDDIGLECVTHDKNI